MNNKSNPKTMKPSLGGKVCAFWLMPIKITLQHIAGSGISGIILKAAGPQLEAAAKPFAPLTPEQAIITPAFNLSAKYIVHTVYPR
jgi:O-acetyl-ADP-ribose deacetylase (regulator of RNase III)